MIETEITTIDELIAYLQSIKELNNINGEAKLYIEAHEEAGGYPKDGIVASYNPTTHTIEFEPNMYSAW